MRTCSALLVLLLVGAGCARYEDGYRGGNQRSRFSSEETPADSDSKESHEFKHLGFDERRYQYESDESRDSSEERTQDNVYFSKRKLHHYVDNDAFFDDVRTQKQDSNRVPQDYHRERYTERRQHDHREKQPASYEHHYKEEGYSWKQDRDKFAPLPAINIAPAEKPHKYFVASSESADPPPPSEAARMARYVVHHSDWTTVATTSTIPKIRGYPFANVLSVSDGPMEQGSGIPYLYLTPLDFTPHDLMADRRCSLTLTLAETDYCKKQSFDPEDPRCARVTLSGEMWKLRNGTEAAKIAEKAMFSRHPAMKTWPKDHNFFFVTLKIEQIVLLDYFGGAKYISVKDYLRASA